MVSNLAMWILINAPNEGSAYLAATYNNNDEYKSNI